MIAVLKALLAALVFYAASTWLYFIWLGVFMLLVGTDTGVPETLTLVGTRVMGTVTFLVGIALFRRVLEGVGASKGVRTGALVAYGLLASSTLLMLVVNIEVPH
jgi:hypothetical protein